MTDETHESLIAKYTSVQPFVACEEPKFFNKR